MNSTDPILDEVMEIVAEVLALDMEEVHPSARFFEDLHGESIDLLDLSFHCDKRFNVKLPIQRAVPDDQLSVDEKGVLTAESLSLLKRELPFLDYSRIEDNPLKNRLTELWTVEAIAEFVRRELACRPADQAGGEGLSALTA